VTAPAVLLAATYDEARVALALLPPEEDPRAVRLLSCWANAATADGLRVGRLYVAPGASRGHAFEKAMATLRRGMLKTRGAEPRVVHL
jgi:hypothetical protein